MTAMQPHGLLLCALPASPSLRLRLLKVTCRISSCPSLPSPSPTASSSPAASAAGAARKGSTCSPWWGSRGGTGSGYAARWAKPAGRWCGSRTPRQSGGGGGGEGKPVASARATGNWVFRDWDVMVEPSLQGLGLGLGKAVMERLDAEPRAMGVSNIALYAERSAVGFYHPLGFAADPDGIKGMVYSRRNQ